MAAFEYKYRINGIVKAPAEVTGEVCQNIINEEGTVTPKKLVDVSRPKDAPLHDEFEWNDDVAAEKYREEQARQIIKNIVIIDFVPTDTRQHEYVTIDTALNNADWRNNLIESAKRDMLSFIHKYKRLGELNKIIADMNEFLGA